MVTSAVGIPGMDLDAVSAWMDSRDLGEGSLSQVQGVGGGTQNLMLRFTRSDREYVLRRGPEHLRPISNRVIARECQVLRALAETDVPHARLIAACEDPSILGDAIFYLMEPIDGFCAGLELPADAAGSPQLRKQMGFALVDALLTLEGVDYREIGLADFGKPDGFLDRQVDRWLSELAGYHGLSGYPSVQLPHLEPTAEWLQAQVPHQWTPGLIHGDFHASNVMFRRDQPQVAAIVDWEMATLGDPLLDLGWLIATWDLPGAPEEFAGLLTRAGGLPTADELAQRYVSAASRAVDNLTWYIVMACFKLGIILEGSHARAQSGLAPITIGDRLHTTACALFERAHSTIKGAS